MAGHPYNEDTMTKLSLEQTAAIKQDLFTLARGFNAFRQNTSQYLTAQGLNPKDKNLDPFYLYEGGSDLTKQFHKDWQLASKIAIAKGLLSVMKYAGSDHTGFNLRISETPIEEVSKAFMWVPGVTVPNKWTGNKFSQSKRTTTLLLSFACNFDGSIRSLWAAIAELTSNPDGKTGDWTFSADTHNAAFSSLTLTQSIFSRTSYQQIVGNLELDYGVSGDAKKGMKLLLDKLPVDVSVNIGASPVPA